MGLKNPKNKQPAFCFEIKKGKDYLFSAENEYMTFAEDTNPPIEPANDENVEQQNKQLFYFLLFLTFKIIKAVRQYIF